MATVDNDLGKQILDAQITRETRVYLYDPPKGGLTPVDGEGNPQKSPVRLADVPAKLKLGFTEEPLVAAGPPAEEVAEEKPRRAKKSAE